MTPFYGRLPGVAGFGVERSADLIGAALAVGTAAGVGAHAIATGIHRRREGKRVTPLPVMPGNGGQGAPPASSKEDSDA
jgi:hydrogenase small subunit